MGCGPASPCGRPERQAPGRQDVEKARKFARAVLVKLLPVVDSLERATREAGRRRQ